MKVIVTGGAGFIGSHLVDALVKRGDSVTVLDNFCSGQQNFLKRVNEKIKIREIDLLNDDFSVHLEGAEVVFHAAANPEVRIGETQPEIMFEQNVKVTEKVLETMESVGVSNISFTSTSTVYGEATIIPTPENYGPLAPISEYGKSKLAAERLIEEYCAKFGFRAVSLRFANCVGSRSNHGVTFDFVNKLRENNEQLTILGDGSQSKSYFHVEDCISSILAVLPTDVCSEGEFCAFNVGSEDAIDVVTVADTICNAMKLEGVGYEFTGGVDGGRGWKGDVKTMLLSIELLKSKGWKPKFDSQEAVYSTAKWLAERY